MFCRSKVPPLRKRLQDVPLLVAVFSSHFELNGRSRVVERRGHRCAQHYSWPGNVRELKEALEFAVAHSVGWRDLARPTSPKRSPKAVGAGTEDEAFASSELNLARLERQAILRALQSCGFDKAKSARLLGIGKTTMYRKLKEMSGKT